MSICTFGECTRKTLAHGLCAGHVKQRARGGRLHALAPARGGALGAKDPLDRLKDAANEYADAVQDGDWESAWQNLIDSAKWVALGVPKRPRYAAVGYTLLAQLRADMRSIAADMRRIAASR